MCCIYTPTYRLLKFTISLTGLYECTFKGGVLDYIQKGSVTRSNIVQAPNIRLSSVINAHCVNGTGQLLKCCVQPGYNVTWFNNELPLESSMYSLCKLFSLVNAVTE